VLSGDDLLLQQPKPREINSFNSRLILAFFPAEDAAARRAAGRITQPGVRSTLNCHGGKRNPGVCRYFDLRLPGEQLLVADAATTKAQSVVEKIRLEHPLGVFVIPGAFSRPTDFPSIADPNDLSWAQNAARSTSPPASAIAPFLRDRLLALEGEFERATADLSASVSLGHAPGPATSWILENSYLVHSEADEIRRDFENASSRRSPGANFAQVHALACGLLAHSEHEISEEGMQEALREFQSVRYLTMAELWNFAQMLRVALLEELSRLASDAANSQQHREAAYLWADRLIASVRQGEDQQKRILARMEQETYAQSGTFLAPLAELLQGEEDALRAFQTFAEKGGRPLNEFARTENTLEAYRAGAAARAFGSLRALARLDTRRIFEQVGIVDQELRHESSGIYAASDFETRGRCRQAVERISGWCQSSEREVAQMAVALAEEQSDPSKRQASYFLVAEGIATLEQRAHARLPLRVRFIRATRDHSVSLYFLSVFALTASLGAVALELAHGSGVRNPLLLSILGILAVLPLSELAIQIVHAFIVAIFPPSRLARMDFESGIPNDCATLVVVPMMLTDEGAVNSELEKLEVRYLANRDANLSFALFSDFTDAPERDRPGDSALVQAASSGITRLNERYDGGNFLLFHRPREWSPSEECWIGRERKRGKIEDLNAFLTGHGAQGVLRTGHLRGAVRYVITLDSDTVLPANSARRMVETIAHPCNQVQIDPDTRVRLKGYSIIQPRVAIALPGATATRFTRTFADTSGLDPYCRSVSDIQQDYFNEGTYHGKAIYDVSAFSAILGDRFPSEALLSHDLIEGAHAGVGLATDIELLENIPLDYSSFCRRQHRWIRGDWQIAPWLFSKVPGPNGAIPNPLTAITRWRIFDNLRRSLVPVASLLLLLFGWLTSAVPSVWSVVVALAILIPAMAPLVDRWARQLEGTVHGRQGASDDLIRSAVLTAFLPHQAWLAIDAIVRACYRRCISHRHLLEWQTADAAERNAGREASATRRQMMIVAAVSAALIPVLYHVHHLAPTAGFLGLWLTSPLLLFWLNRPAVRTPSEQLQQSEMDYLSQVARRTWRYFDDLVSEESHWLPPDNTQLALRVEVARRTSPTNIGLWLISALAARDFGWLTTAGFAKRCGGTLATIELLERQDGHLFNWYDIDALKPLSPRYISAADSGNLVASLWTADRAIDELIAEPVLDRTCLTGLLTTLSILAGTVEDDLYLDAPCRAAARLLRVELQDYELIPRLRLVLHAAEPFRGVGRWESGSDGGRAYWASRFAAEVDAWLELVDQHLRWVDTLSRPAESFLLQFGGDVLALRQEALRSIPSLADLERGIPSLRAIVNRTLSPEMPPEAAAWIEQLKAEVGAAEKNAAATALELRKLQRSMRQLADGTDIRSLYDARRRHLAVGYIAAAGPPKFTSHYDLLASEARLTSLVAIAKGDVPLNHWFALGRPMRTEPQGRQLLSWSGTMFEFLMPLLFTVSFENSLLDMACRNAVKGQTEFGELSRVPWGLSESAYSALDARQIYQYRAFGVRELAQNPDADNRLVVSPYSTMLALAIEPRLSVANLKRLEKAGMTGPMGFYEAIDYTRAATRDGTGGLIIYAYMAHHQGMTMAALDNLVHHDVIRRRFHCDPRVRAIESLLYERIPLARLRPGRLRPMTPTAVQKPPEELTERVLSGRTVLPQTLLMGNGRYSVMVTNAGSGYSRWNQFDITRWRSDAVLDDWGTFVILHERRSGVTWSATHQPLKEERGEASATFATNRADFRRYLVGIESVVSVAVSPEDDVEVRKVTILNHTRRRRFIEITSFAELALAPHAADAAHAAFSKLFVETEWNENVILAHRRLRSPDEPPVWVAHMVVGAHGNVECETNRQTFIGRARSIATAEALDRSLNGSAGAVLDAAASLRCRETLEARGKLEVSFLTMAASSKEDLLKLVARYSRLESAVRVLDLAWTHEQLEFRQLQIGAGTAHSYQRLAGYLIFPSSPPLRGQGSRPNVMGQRDLWALGISGDLPIITVMVREPSGLKLIREILAAHSYWRTRGFTADLVILNQEAASYDRPLNFQLQRILDAHTRGVGTERPGGVFLRDWTLLSDAQRALIISSSRVLLAAVQGALARQLPAVRELTSGTPFNATGLIAEEPSPPLPFLELSYFNGVGGFSPDGREYAIYLAPGAVTPAPWANVIGTPEFGCVVTESGLGCTWEGNSQQNRLTTWQNDPVSDPVSEAIYLRDEDSGVVFTPTALPIREEDAYRARHGQGYTVYEHNSHAIGQELTVFIPFGNDGPRDSVKICRLRLRNDSSVRRRLTVTYYAELVLGSQRDDQAPHVFTTFDEESGAVLAREHWSPDNREAVAFAAAIPRAGSHSGGRAAFLGRNGTAANPAGLRAAQLDNYCGSDTDPAAVIQVPVTIPVGGAVDVAFLLGQALRVENVRDIIGAYREAGGIEKGLSNARAWWDTRLDTVQVQTPSRSVDLLLNRWLLYQTLSCRLWGRCAVYQSSGAFGFRDQLQDSMALLYSAPELARTHILRAAARQFSEGDVQHWWHPGSGAGVRTRCSDDLIWLPYTIAQYVSVTGDRGVLDELVPFLEGPALKPDEMEHLFTPGVSVERQSVWEHCRRALDAAWRLGAHGLPLIGGCDWNDGFNRVGNEGRGESVWLAWFLLSVLRRFADLEDTRDATLAALYRDRAAQLQSAVQDSCWDGDWFLRGFFDDGSPLGAHGNTEARIDSLPQSWSVISGAGDPTRAQAAMAAANRELVKDSEGLVLLFTPPFDHSAPHPGYIMGYPPGIRENGGQYTHGALWLAMAWARLGNGQQAVRLLQLMNPIEHCKTPEDIQRYRGEPYVAAADVYASPLQTGQCGWTWYTGSAAWMYRVWVEEVLGFRRNGNSFVMRPVIPAEWPGFRMSYRHEGTTYKISVVRAAGSPRVELDGQVVPDGVIPLVSHSAPRNVVIHI
jgi:cyclic beta-1,2-glucan synthetase